MKKKRLFLTSLFFLIFVGCTDMQTILENYNENFTVYPPQTEIIDYALDDQAFNPSDMLADVYDVVYNGRLSILAPVVADSYSWQVYETNDAVSCVVLATTKQLNVYFPETSLQESTPYILKLVVTDSSGNEYSDTAVLALFSN